MDPILGLIANFVKHDLHKRLLILEASYRTKPLDEDELTQKVWNWTFNHIDPTKILTSGRIMAPCLPRVTDSFFRYVLGRNSC